MRLSSTGRVIFIYIQTSTGQDKIKDQTQDQSAAGTQRSVGSLKISCEGGVYIKCKLELVSSMIEFG